MFRDVVKEQLPFLEKFYAALPAKIAAARELFGRPLTFAEKLLCAHGERTTIPPRRGDTHICFDPDRVAMQDATAQMALLQFMQARRDSVAVPATIHCDHLIAAHVGAAPDVEEARRVNREVYDFLASAAARYGLGFWGPGAGIIHQVVFENYAFPGGMMIGTDSHTPNAGGLGMLAIGVGGADAAEVLAGLAWTLRWPKLVGVRLTGRLSGWTAPKDIVLRLASLLTVKGGTGKIVEYVGPGTETVSCTGKGTIANMGAEIGATCSLFPFDEKMAAYLEATGRGDVARLARGVADHLRPDPEVVADPASFFDELIEIDLDELRPQVVGPHTPDLGRPAARLAEDVAKNGWPPTISAALIGSCTNSSYEDIGRAAHVARAALARGLKARVPFYVTPGSEAVFATCERDGLLAPLRELGAVVLANACGPCIGQWRRDDVEAGAANSIVTSFNRNFPKRNDGNAATHAFIASPEVVVAYAVLGRLDADPLTFDPPAADELPAAGFEARRDAYVAPPADGRYVEVVVDPESSRLQLLEPFAPWDGRDFERLPVLLKARGKCTTDHISPAGPWLKYRGHLDKISDNMFTGATNAFTARPGTAVCLLDHQESPTPQVARAYKAAGLDWIVVGDENYGEGSSREHAAMSPRHLGCKAVIARSFARIHETNLKKQGILALVFSDPADYDAIGPKDRVSVVGLSRFASGRPLTVRVHHPDGGADEFPVRHSYTEEEIGWFRAGSAMNTLAR